MEGSSMDGVNSLFESAARLDRVGISVTRIGLAVVLVRIGGLKAFRYEDEGIVPFVANSPFMNLFYRQPVGEYRRHMNREGELVPANRQWHERNGTYRFAYGLGALIVAYGVMIALHPWQPRLRGRGFPRPIDGNFCGSMISFSLPPCGEGRGEGLRHQGAPTLQRT
jgi:uncharacterized membrane protein YkgB